MLLFLVLLLLLLQLVVFAQFGPRGCHPKASPPRGKQAQLSPARPCRAGPARRALLGQLGHAVLAHLGTSLSICIVDHHRKITEPWNYAPDF